MAVLIVNYRKFFPYGFNRLVLCNVIPFKRACSSSLIAIQYESDQIVTRLTWVAEFDTAKPVNALERHAQNVTPSRSGPQGEAPPLGWGSLMPSGAAVPPCWHEQLPH